MLNPDVALFITYNEHFCILRFFVPGKSFMNTFVSCVFSSRWGHFLAEKYLAFQKCAESCKCQ